MRNSENWSVDFPMNDPRWWFDMHNAWHVVGFVLSILALNGALYIAFWPSSADVVSIRKPLIILDVVPHANEVALGEPYPVTFEFNKTRDDCQSGHIIRHMWNVETGWTYLIDDRPTVQAPVGIGKFRADLSTKPLDPRKRELMQPGLWRIDSLVSYACPDTHGGTVLRQTSFSTPVFRVIDAGKEKGAR